MESLLTSHSTFLYNQIKFIANREGRKVGGPFCGGHDSPVLARNTYTHSVVDLRPKGIYCGRRSKSEKSIYSKGRRSTYEKEYMVYGIKVYGSESWYTVERV